MQREREMSPVGRKSRERESLKLKLQERIACVCWWNYLVGGNIEWCKKGSSRFLEDILWKGKKKWKIEQNWGTRFEGEHDGSDGKESACSAGDPSLIPALGRSRGEGNPFQFFVVFFFFFIPVFLPEEFHGQRSLAGYGPLGHIESDMTEWLTHTHRMVNLMTVTSRRPRIWYRWWVREWIWWRESVEILLRLRKLKN